MHPCPTWRSNSCCQQSRKKEGGQTLQQLGAALRMQMVDTSMERSELNQEEVVEGVGIVDVLVAQRFHSAVMVVCAVATARFGRWIQVLLMMFVLHVGVDSSTAAAAASH